MRRVVVAVVCLSLAFLPANLRAQGIPAFTSCHGEVEATQIDGKLSVTYDPTRLYQKFTYHIRSYGGAHVAKIETVELRHQQIADPADHSGLRDPDSVKQFYRVEYSNVIKTKTESGEDVESYVQILSGPNGLLLEILTLLPIKNAPAVQGDEPIKETKL